MRAEQKANVKNSIGRLAFVGISLLIQVMWIVLLFERLNEYSTTISLLSSVLALVVAMRVYVKNMNAAFKMPWIILILFFPVLGLCIYGVFGNSNATKKVRKHYEEIEGKLDNEMIQDKVTMENLENKDFLVANQSRYLVNYGGYPIYQNTDVVYYSDAAVGFEAQIEEIRKAKSFIFMEYHAIEEAESFARLKSALAERAAAGVEVRLFYDDVGSVGFINKDFIKRMEAVGIQCRVFNPMIPFLNVFMNNRDHRKITIIDGKVGFTGGYNLADEYFNITHPYGHWKDSGVKLTGDAVKSLTVMFLRMWNTIKETDSDFSKYLPSVIYEAKESGFVQPYADSPFNGEYIGENVYLNMIKSAKHYFYITTPYLIISDEMNRELGLAAKRGVDVRIVTPRIPDKKLVYKVTRSYYAGLVLQGVKIFEYVPGFMHQKQAIADGDIAVVGTINLDYRSLYHHFENGVFLYKMNSIGNIKDDFDSIFKISEDVTEKYKNPKSAVLRGTRSILRLFAPLL